MVLAGFYQGKVFIVQEIKKLFVLQNLIELIYVKRN